MNPELVDARFSALDALGSAPDARASFFLRRQKKGAKEKATSALRGRRCRLPCATRTAGRLRNSGFALRQSSPTAPGRTPLLGAARGGWHTERNLERNVIQLAAAIRSVFNLPFASSSSAGRNGKKGEDCLRANGPSSAAPRCERAAQSTRRSRATQRARLLLGYFFLARQEEVRPRVRRGTGRLSHARRQRTTRNERNEWDKYNRRTPHAW
jgi:hypothetical protein